MDSVSLTTLRTRQDFLRVAGSGRRWITQSFIVQADPDARSDGGMGIGYTSSRKVGGAVTRNRSKRRLRAVVRSILPRYGECGWDYVLIARRRDKETPFKRLEADLRWALKKLARGEDRKAKP